MSMCVKRIGKDLEGNSQGLKEILISAVARGSKK
jgi:hypothetical protein